MTFFRVSSLDRAHKIAESLAALLPSSLLADAGTPLQH